MAEEVITDSDAFGFRRRNTTSDKLQDKVNTADSALLFLISQTQWLDWSVQRTRSCLVGSLLER